MRFRYPGPDSFGDAPFDSRMFFGRKEEVLDLANHVAGARLVVLYGKSGLGKTSLLQAGLFPRLREMGFVPIKIRPAEVAESVVDVVLTQLEKTCAECGYGLTTSAGESLFELFQNTAISRGERFERPVLVIDQFEEVFNRFDKEARSALIAEIQSLVYPRASRGLPPDVRVVLSLREEYVGALDEFSTALPGVLAHRYRLRPMSRENAKEAVAEPSKVFEDEDVTPAFEFSETAVKEMLDYLEDSQGDVEPIELQILCQHIERAVVRRSKQGTDLRPVEISDYFPDGMQSALSNYYLNIVREFSGSTRKRVRRMCETGLVTQDGYRDSIRGRRIKTLYGLDDSVIDGLVDKRLLRREDRLNDVWFELTHDRIAEAVAACRAGSRSSAIALRLVEGMVAVTACTLVFSLYSFLLAEQRAPVLQEISCLSFQVPRAPTLVDTSESRAALADALEPLAQRGLVAVHSDQYSTIIVLPSDNLFDSGSFELRPEYRPVVEEIGTAVSQVDARIVVIGHTDSSAASDLRYGTSVELTQYRADSVRFALVGAGLGFDSMDARGLGTCIPVASNETKTGRALNRRVEIEVIHQGGAR